jgi:alpha-D-ribose 1-methylphosphonate 5-triphosphate synthase subunit PhnG
MYERSRDKGVTIRAAMSPRQRWLATLAHAMADEVVAHAARWSHVPLTELRPPETGLVLLRARMGGSGDRFNVGEATVTRCVLRCAGSPDTVGVGYCLGLHVERARAIALFDALLQQAEHQDRLLREVIAPLEARVAQDRAAQQARTATSRVAFSTLQSEVSA